MFYSQCLLSSKGPLGAIWVAAYFFKKLKKAQVTETDISASVDKILQDEVNVVAYRVLAYLLLGVVRIYSKKVEYLFDDCHEALIKINDFVVSTKERTHTRTLSVPYFSITLPEKFELDAFDLEILDDVSGGNVVSREEITLKDGAWENEQMGRYSLDKYHYEEISVFHRTSSMDYTFTDNILSSGPMDIDMGVSTSYNLTCIEAQMENLQEKSFSRAECVDREMFCEGEEEPMDPYTPFGEYHQTNGETTKVLAIRQSEGKVPGEANRGKHHDNSFSQEGLVNVEMFSTTNREPLDHVNLSAEDHQVDGGQRKFLELAQENQMHYAIQEVSGVSNLETSLEKLRGDKFSQEECMDPGLPCGAKEEPSKLARRFEEEPHDYTETIRLPTLTSSENRKCQVNTEENPLSITLDGTPQSKFPDASGASMPELIHTPSVRERARVSRRKCLIERP
ncbi:Sister chromatid cohesion 1 protein 2 [Morella rubra]|uniref:Sister chromatid cohesion 1 protein 2 n=1 Tax=Morella rubra TaxID=262757 RepID=A0A6A1VIS0_9ROSI|nr:Sister chromatid cohesion 1 protein 2 [Morella rubra]